MSSQHRKTNNFTRLVVASTIGSVGARAATGTAPHSSRGLERHNGTFPVQLSSWNGTNTAVQANSTRGGSQAQGNIARDIHANNGTARPQPDKPDNKGSGNSAGKVAGVVSVALAIASAASIGGYAYCKRHKKSLEQCWRDHTGHASPQGGELIPLIRLDEWETVPLHGERNPQGAYGGV